MSSNQITDYKIITEWRGRFLENVYNQDSNPSVRNSRKLESRVQQLIVEGWEPSGSVAICDVKGILTYSQAMVLYQQVQQVD